MFMAVNLKMSFWPQSFIRLSQFFFFFFFAYFFFIFLCFTCLSQFYKVSIQLMQIEKCSNPRKFNWMWKTIYFPRWFMSFWMQMKASRTQNFGCNLKLNWSFINNGNEKYHIISWEMRHLKFSQEILASKWNWFIHLHCYYLLSIFSLLLIHDGLLFINLLCICSCIYKSCMMWRKLFIWWRTFWSLFGIFFMTSANH